MMKGVADDLDAPVRKRGAVAACVRVWASEARMCEWQRVISGSGRLRAPSRAFDRCTDANACDLTRACVVSCISSRVHEHRVKVNSNLTDNAMIESFEQIGVTIQGLQTLHVRHPSEYM
jgi:hypothetical protein